MASNALKRVAGVLLAALVLGAAAVGQAQQSPSAIAQSQSPAVNPQEADLARAQAAQQQKQPLNNQPVWKEVRSGLPQTTSLPGRETNVLIQSQGQTWRAARVTVSTALGLVIAGLVAVLFAYYFWRGTIELHGRPTGRVIERFSPARRFAHWAMGLTFVALAITGLIITFGKSLLLPLIGATLFSWLAALAKSVHNFTGPVFSVALVIFIVMYVKDNLPKAHDVQWMLKFGGMLDRSGNSHVPSGKFNAGEKGLFWSLVVLASLVLVVSGYVLNFPNFDQTRETMQLANIVHMIAGLLAVAMACVHIYMGTVGMRGAYQAMRTGYVDETWAKEHHEHWYNDVMSGKVPRGSEPEPQALPQGRAA
jgi:formate dehydrogenase subunit gamma